MRKLLKNSELQLMRYSKQIENNYYLQGLIEKNIKEGPIKIDDMLRPFFKEEYTRMLEICKKEWVVVVEEFKYIEDEVCICELCGHKKIKNICVIRNIYTGKRLKVGTGCIDNITNDRDVNINSIFYKIKKHEEIDYFKKDKIA